MSNNPRPESIVLRTPLLPFFPHPLTLNATIYLKAENLQPLGSFKIRGIDSLFKSIPIEHFKKGIAAPSAGNMGQAIAFMAQKYRIPCKIFVPDTTPEIKKEKIRKLGATLEELPMRELWKLVANPPQTMNGMYFVHPFFTDALLKGYERIAEEILCDLPDVEAVVVPLGIGGLAMAIARAFKKLKPDTAIYVCEPETAAPFKASLLDNKPASIQMLPSFVDAIGTPETLPEVYKLLAPLIIDSEVVKLENVKKALHQLFANHKLICEGAAACGLAAAIQIAEHSEHKNIVCILTGGNLSNDYVRLII